MLAFAASLLTGPQYLHTRSPRRGAIAAALPLLALAAAAAVMCLAGLLGQPHARTALADLALRAGGATVGCIVMALPASLARPGPGWLLLAWLALGVGPAGCALVALPPGAWGAMAATAVILLPVMVIGLGAAWSKLPAGIWHTAAGLGARWPAILAALLPVALPAIVRTCLVVFALAVGIGAGLS